MLVVVEGIYEKEEEEEEEWVEGVRGSEQENLSE